MTLVDPKINGNYNRIDVGLYEIGHFNMNLMLGANPNFTWNGFFNLHDVLIRLDEDYLSSYGVCDSPEQFMNKIGKLLINSKEEFCVSFTRINKADQEPSGGWRWHKWGPYIGKGKPTDEYLYNEPEFTHVYCYHVYKKSNR